MDSSLDQALHEEYRHLCLAVGHLFITFARLEGCLSSILKLHLADAMGGMTDKRKVRLSSAIYGSMRFAAARDTIKRLAAAESVSEQTVTFANSIFAHVGAIQDLRDRIAHHQIVPAFEGAGAYWQVSDQIATRDIRRPKVYVFDSVAVVSAANDLNTAAVRLGGPAKSGHVLQAVERDLQPIAWLYKPSMLRLVSLNELRGVV
jgi:hypothetical protein